MAKVTGIGGIFFKSKSDDAALAAWYQEHLGLTLEGWGGSILKWTDDKVVDGGLTVWSLAAKDSKWFSPSESSFMINYRVDNLVALVEQLKKEDVTIVDEIEEFEYGKFIHILDLEGNRVELWEANDEAYAKMATAVTK